MKKHKFNKIWAILMSLCLLAGTLPAQAEASKTAESGETFMTLNLGTAALEAPKQNADTWSGSKVYLGGLKGKTSDTPILWRVLAVSKEEILLQSDSILSQGIFKEAPAKTASAKGLNKWLGSDVRIYLNERGTGGFLEGFDKLIYDAILEKNIPEGEKTVSDGDAYTNPASEKSRVFLLSAAESTCAEYGYGKANARRMVSGGDAVTGDVMGDWWLRSALSGSETEAAVIDKDGKLTYKAVVTTGAEGTEAEYAGIAPALYLDSEKVVFITPSSKTKSSEIAAVEEYTGAKVWKLTLEGSKGDLNAVAVNGSEFERNQTIELEFDSASGLKKGEFVPTQVSALILDKNGSPVYYGKLGDADVEKASWKIPADMKSGEYELYLFAEDINGKKEADYAGALGDAITFRVAEKETPVLVEKPTASAVLYGQSLSDSLITGGRMQILDQIIEGTFSWKDSGVKPVVADSNVTEYDVIFTPADTDKYYQVELKLSVEVKKAQIPEPLPEQTVTVDYSIDTVNKVTLPEGWSWKQEEQEKALAADAQTQATAVYQDTANYENTELIIAITRNGCTHNGEKEVRNVVDATCTEEGYYGDTYCAICGSLLEQGTVETVDAHYYNNSRIVNWQGCEQQEEVEYYCSCGDSYIVVTQPALGHDFKAQITRQATTAQTGIKTYTCSRCGHAYTEEIPKLASSATQKNDDTVESRMPYVKGNGGISGWNDINKHILKAADGTTIQIVMNGSFILPEKILTTIKGKNLTLQLELGQDVIWKVTGTDVTGDKLADINLKVIKNSNTIPSDVVTALAGERSTMQVSFAQEADFGATLELQVLLGIDKTGTYSNQFIYDKESKTLTYQASIPMADATMAVLTIDKPAEYLIVLDAEAFDGTVKEEPQTTPETEEKPDETQTMAPIDDTATQQNNDGISAILIIIIGLIVLGIGLLVIVILRARSRREYE